MDHMLLSHRYHPPPSMFSNSIDHHQFSGHPSSQPTNRAGITHKAAIIDDPAPEISDSVDPFAYNIEDLLDFSNNDSPACPFDPQPNCNSASFTTTIAAPSSTSLSSSARPPSNFHKNDLIPSPCEDIMAELEWLSNIVAESDEFASSPRPRNGHQCPQQTYNSSRNGGSQQSGRRDGNCEQEESRFVSPKVRVIMGSSCNGVSNRLWSEKEKDKLHVMGRRACSYFTNSAAMCFWNTHIPSTEALESIMANNSASGTSSSPRLSSEDNSGTQYDYYHDGIDNQHKNHDTCGYQHDQHDQHDILEKLQQSAKKKRRKQDHHTKRLYVYGDDQSVPNYKTTAPKHEKSEFSEGNDDDEYNGAMGGNVAARKCSHCGSQKTPQWRAGPEGPKTLCNACGVRYKSGRLFPEYRPAASPTFIQSLHSNSHRRVLEMRKQREGVMDLSNGGNSNLASIDDDDEDEDEDEDDDGQGESYGNGKGHGREPYYGSARHGRGHHHPQKMMIHGGGHDHHHGHNHHHHQHHQQHMLAAV